MLGQQSTGPGANAAGENRCKVAKSIQTEPPSIRPTMMLAALGGGVASEWI